MEGEDPGTSSKASEKLSAPLMGGPTSSRSRSPMRHNSNPGPMLAEHPGRDLTPPRRANSTHLTSGELYMSRRRRMRALRRWYGDFLDQFESYKYIGEEEAYSSDEESEEGRDGEGSEGSPLLSDSALTTSATARRQRHAHVEAGMGRAVVTYLKGMIGTYVLYIPHLFSLGGYSFSVAFLILTAFMSHVNMILLLNCRHKTGRTSFGDIARAAAGDFGKSLVDLSLFLTQLGYCITYFIYVAKNVSAATGLDPLLLLVSQVFIYAPLSWVRRLKYLGPSLFLAQCGLILGLVLTLGYVARELIVQGVDWDEVDPLKGKTWVMYIGAVVSAFEGIGLVLPIHESLNPSHQQEFPALLKWCNGAIMCFYIFVGLLGYFTYGNRIPPFLTEVMPQNTLGSVTQLSYSFAVILSFPLQLFPAVRVLENRIWAPRAPDWLPMGSNKRRNIQRTIAKSAFRTLVVLAAAGVALIAGEKFDNFVAIVGGLCSVPLALIYPVWFHCFIFWSTLTPLARAMHLVSILLGITAAIASTAVSIYDIF